MLCHFVYVTLYYLMSVTLLSFCFRFGIDGMSAESRCTWSRSKHPNINTQGCIYKISHQRRQLHRRSTVWTKANGFLSSRPVIPTEPGPGMSIPHKLQHRIETERFAMSCARRFENESFPKCPSRSHYEPVSGGDAGHCAGPRLLPRVLAAKCTESGCARTTGEGSVERCCASAVGTSA